MSSTKKIILALLDKGVLAIFALIAGYWLNRRFEQQKRAQEQVSALERDKIVLENEINRVRRTHHMEFKEKQLALFYWPIYIRFAKDSALWRIVPQLTRDPTPVPGTVGQEIESKQLIKNHEEIIAINEANIHLAQADQQMVDLISAYTRHVAVYRALRDSKIYDLNPIDVGEPMPEEFMSVINRRLLKLQAEYDDLVQPRL